MSNIAVVYKSDYGAARCYAIYIAKALGADLYDLRRIREFDFSRYGTVIFGGGLYAGRINGLHFIVSHGAELADKKLVVYTTGLMDPALEANFRRTENAVRRALPDTLMEKAAVFCFRGAIDYRELRFGHRVAMRGLRRFLLTKKADRLSPDERTILETYGKSVSFIDTSTADPLITYIKDN